MQVRKLSQEWLKAIACLTMLIDHFGHAIVPVLPVPYIRPLYYGCWIIGRLAFPIYCFLLVEGMHRTRNPLKYILRLAIGILLAELPYDLLFEGAFTWTSQSVMVTLTLGAMMLLCMKKLGGKWLSVFMVIPFALLADWAKCDYGGWGIAMIAVFALFKTLPVKTMGVLLLSAEIPSAGVDLFGVRVSVQLFAVLAMGLIAVYSGKKLTHSRAVQWEFYLFYPVHLLVLWMILMFIR